MKTGHVLLALGVVAVGVGVYLHVNQKEKEEKLSAAGVYKGGGGYYVRCANGGTSIVYDSYEKAASMVDTHCRDRGGSGVVEQVSGPRRLSAIKYRN